MYISTILDGNPNMPDYGSSYAVGGTRVFLTERYPWFTVCIASKPDALANRPLVSFSIRTDPMPPYFHPARGATFITGLKFARQDAAISGHGSFFILVRYKKQPGNLTYIPKLGQVKDFALVAGDGHPSLTSFMLDDEAVAKAFRKTGNSVVLQNLGNVAAWQRFTCLGLNGGSPKLGTTSFEFCLDAE
jgi:hypothetical protein